MRNRVANPSHRDSNGTFGERRAGETDVTSREDQPEACANVERRSSPTNWWSASEPAPDWAKPRLGARIQTRIQKSFLQRSQAADVIFCGHTICSREP